MAKKNRLQIIMEDPTEQTSCILIGEMPTVSQNPLFEIIRVFSNLKHADVMICFQKHCIQILQIFYNVIIIFSKVCGNAHRMLSTFQAVTHRLCSIMGNGKRIYRQVLDPKRLILPDLVDQSPPRTSAPRTAKTVSPPFTACVRNAAVLAAAFLALSRATLRAAEAVTPSQSV